VFSVLFGFWLISQVAFNGDDMRKLAAQAFTIAERQGSTLPLMIGHRIMGVTKALTGDFSGTLAHFDQSLKLYDPARHRSGAEAGGVDSRVSVLAWRSLAHWSQGYPEAALADADQALKEAREIDQAADLMLALAIPSYTLVLCRSYDEADARINELLALAADKHAPFRKAEGMMLRGSLLASVGKSSDAIEVITSGITAWQSMDATVWLPLVLSYLASAYANIGQFREALRFIAEAATLVETTKQRCWEAEVQRVAGEVVLRSPDLDVAGAQRHLETAIAIAREQQAKSFELRAAMSLARLWRDRGDREHARDLLAPVYGWFTEAITHLTSKTRKRCFAS
jgi:predicted ATPase